MTNDTIDTSEDEDRALAQASHTDEGMVAPEEDVQLLRRISRRVRRVMRRMDEMEILVANQSATIAAQAVEIASLRVRLVQATTTAARRKELRKSAENKA